MARLPKKLDQDRTYDEDFSFDFGFVLALMESTSERLKYAAAETRRRVADLAVDDFVRRVRDLKAQRALRGGVMDAELKARGAALRREAVAISAGFAAIHRWQAEVERLNERCFRHAEMAIVEMVDIIRDRIDVVSSRPDGGESLGEAGAALVFIERMLTDWRSMHTNADQAVTVALRYTIETIYSIDEIAAEGAATAGVRFVPLRDIVRLEADHPHGPQAA